MAGGVDGEEGLSNRTEILHRFEEWLDSALSEEAPPSGIPSELLTGEAEDAQTAPTDMHAMWAAITALTQEVKLQGRAFKQMSDTLVRDTERRVRKGVLDSLLEIRERLLRGLKSIRAAHKEMEALRPAFYDRLFAARWRKVRHSIEAVAAMEEGYRLGLQHLDDLLGQFLVRPIECEGELFDPQCMNAVDIEETSDVSEGTVTSVYRTGYEWNGEVYRPAEVRVARLPRGGAIRE